MGGWVGGWMDEWATLLLSPPFSPTHPPYLPTLKRQMEYRRFSKESLAYSSATARSLTSGLWLGDHHWI